jgi:hypothetical protein
LTGHPLRVGATRAPGACFATATRVGTFADACGGLLPRADRRPPRSAAGGKAARFGGSDGLVAKQDAEMTEVLRLAILGLNLPGDGWQATRCESGRLALRKTCFATAMRLGTFADAFAACCVWRTADRPGRQRVERRARFGGSEGVGVKQKAEISPFSSRSRI